MSKSFPVTFNFKAFQSVTKVTNKIGKSFNKLDRKTKQINNRWQTFNKKNSVMVGRMKAFGNGMKKVGTSMTKFVTLPALAGGVAFTKMAADAEETRSKFNQVFKDIDVGARTKAFKKLGNDYKLADSSAQEFLGTTGLILQGLDLSQKKSLDYGSELVGLAQDVASFRNVQGGAEQVVRAFTGALVGEREKLKTLGIVITETDVKAEALALAKKGLRFETVKEAKAEATLSLIRKRTAKDQGDFARTQESLTNQTRIAKEQFKQTAETLGKDLIPVATKIVKVINKVLKWFQELSPTTRKWMLILTGLAAVMGPILVVLGGLIAMLPFIIFGFQSITLAGTLLFAKFILIAAVIGLVVAALIWLWKNWKSVWAWFKEVVLKGIIDIIKWMFKWLTPIGLMIQAADLIKKNWSGIKEFFLNIFSSIWDAAKPLLDILMNILTAPAKIIGKLGKKALAFFGFGGDDDKKSDGVKSVASSVANNSKIAKDIARENRTTNDARVRVDFVNAPQGTRTKTVDATGIPPELNLGFNGGMQ